jgi:hypothetical protein
MGSFSIALENHTVFIIRMKLLSKSLNNLINKIVIAYINIILLTKIVKIKQN